MTANPSSPRNAEPLRLGSILKARCPSCHQGPVMKGLATTHRRCPSCGHDFNPEPGFYLGAMMVSFLLTGMVIVPAMIALKLLGASMQALMVFPFVAFLFVGGLLLFYAKVVWLHLEHRMTDRLDGRRPDAGRVGAGEPPAR